MRALLWPGARGTRPIHSSSRRGALAGVFLCLPSGEALLPSGRARRSSCPPRDAAAAVELEDPARDVVEEVAVVGDATTVPGNSPQNRSSQATASASRWLVGSSSSSMSGFDSSRRQSATRRRSPPDSLSRRRRRPAAAQRVHGDLDRALRSQASGGVDLLLQLALLGDQLVHLGVGIAEKALRPR